MSPMTLEIPLRKVLVLAAVCLLIFGALVKSAIQLGTVKYSGRAINAGFSFAALRTAVLAAVRLSSIVSRISMWSMLTFIWEAPVYGIMTFVFEHLNLVDGDDNLLFCVVGSRLYSIIGVFSACVY